MDNKHRELLEKFLRTITVSSNNTKKLFVIGMIGVTGSGKSTVAAKIAESLGLYVASNDEIRRFLNQHGYAGSSPEQELVQEIAEARTHYLLRKKISHIIDADLIKFLDVAKKNAANYGAVLYLLHITCPEETILERLRARDELVSNDLSANLSRVGVDEYNRRKKIHQELGIPSEVFYTIDSSKDLEQEVGWLAEKLRQEKVI